MTPPKLLPVRPARPLRPTAHWCKFIPKPFGSCKPSEKLHQFKNILYFIEQRIWTPDTVLTCHSEPQWCHKQHWNSRKLLDFVKNTAVVRLLFGENHALSAGTTVPIMLWGVKKGSIGSYSVKLWAELSVSTSCLQRSHWCPDDFNEISVILKKTEIMNVLRQLLNCDVSLELPVFLVLLFCLLEIDFNQSRWFLRGFMNENDC